MTQISSQSRAKICAHLLEAGAVKEACYGNVADDAGQVLLTGGSRSRPPAPCSNTFHAAQRQK